MSGRVSAELLNDVQQFIYFEARLQDEHQYEAWEKLWTDDAIYWVPANSDDIDPEEKMSIVYDNRSRISLRVKQLLSGSRHTQTPASRLRRVISNVEVLGTNDNGDLSVGANTMVFESNLRGDTVWATRNEYLLREANGEYRLAYKKVMLVNNDKALYTLSFLI